MIPFDVLMALSGAPSKVTQLQELHSDYLISEQGRKVQLQAQSKYQYINLKLNYLRRVKKSFQRSTERQNSRRKAHVKRKRIPKSRSR